MINAALVGIGFIGGVHLESLKRIPDINLKYICDIDIKKAKKAAQACGCKATQDVDEIIVDKEIDCVIHALPTYERISFIKKYAAAGKHIFCEKPIARRIEEAEEIFTILKNYKKKVQFGHVLRYFWEYKSANELIKTKHIGEPGIIRLSRCSGFPFGSNGWYGDFSKSGGCALDLIIHDFDWLIWTFGKPDRVAARGLLEKKMSTDYTLAILHFKNGMIAHVEGSWAEPPNTFYTSFEISGTGGIIEYDSRAQKPLAYVSKTSEGKSAPGVIIPESPSYDNPYFNQMKDFITCIKEDRIPTIGVSDALAAARVSYAALESIKNNGEPVKIL